MPSPSYGADGLDWMAGMGRRDEDALNDPSRDIADGEGLVLPTSDRVEHDGCSDVRDDEEELQECTQADLGVLPFPGEVTGRVVENGLKKKRSGDRCEDVMTNITPKIRAVLWSSAIPSPFEPVGVCLSCTLSIAALIS
jgi:hypothetical protein